MSELEKLFSQQHPDYAVKMGSVPLTMPDGTVTLARKNVNHRGAQLYFRRVVVMAGGRFEVEHHMLVKGRVKRNGISRATAEDIAEWVSKVRANPPGISSSYYLDDQ